MKSFATVGNTNISFSIQLDAILVETGIGTSTDRWAGYLPSLWAAPPSVTVFTKIPSFSRPISAPAPIPMILIPRPSLSEGHTTGQKQSYTHLIWSLLPFVYMSMLSKMWTHLISPITTLNKQWLIYISIFLLRRLKNIADPLWEKLCTFYELMNFRKMLKYFTMLIHESNFNANTCWYCD